MSAEEQVVAPSVSENPEVLADQPTSMVTDEDPTTNGAPVRWDGIDRRETGWEFSRRRGVGILERTES